MRMRSVLSSCLISASIILGVACTQYKPQGKLSSQDTGKVGLVPTGCVGKKDVFNIEEGSSVTWTLEVIAKKSDERSPHSKHRAKGFLETIRGELAKSTGLVIFEMQDLATGDVKRDRALRDTLFTDKGVEIFRLMLEKIDTKESGVGTGNSKSLAMVGIVEIGGRKARVIFPATVTEKDGIYNATGVVELGTRDSRPAINAIYLGDKVKTLEAVTAQSYANTLKLDMSLKLKKACMD